ncbi:hypothetical protein ciss_02400 [Carboxydothermus islandicus]|uniref:Uncharacterized protein n=1 Tax=Carboxydothermus islandicus TaxID=661089 RepID=A0A1L8CZI5_9THEO|nr:hypothetical protein [Carboxydothermus islandicus]GAV24307.1 hypothetical protein ciss_02400 [Carboxydothermus islandicus]
MQNYEKNKSEILEEYRQLRAELHNNQIMRVQLLTYTVGAVMGIVSFVLDKILTKNDIEIGEKMEYLLLSSMIIYLIIIASLLMMRTFQQSVERIGMYIREYIEKELPGLKWETTWFNMKKDMERNMLLKKIINFKSIGSRGWGPIYFILSIMPVLTISFIIFKEKLLGHMFNSFYHIGLLILNSILFFISIFLTFDLEIHITKDWEWSSIKIIQESDASK